MHIALSVPAWPPELHPNGIATYVRHLKREFDRRGHKVSVFSGSVTGSEAGVYAVPLTRLRYLKMRIGELLDSEKTEIFRWGGMMADAMRALHKREPIDVVETEESFGWAGDIVQQLPIPVVVKLHGPTFLTTPKEDLANDLVQQKIRWEGMALAQADYITSPSSHVLASTLLRYGLRPKIGRHLVNPLEMPEDTPQWERSGCDPNMILFVGRFDRLKGGDLVLQAFIKLLERRPAAKLVFVGPDRGILSANRTVCFEEFVQTYVPAQWLDRIDYRGQLEPKQIVHLRTQAQVTVVASRFENQSYTGLEAMWQSCPVVSTDVGGQPEIVQHGVTGLLARPEDREDLAAQIERLLDDPALGERLGQAGREYVQRVHAPSAVAEATMAVYRDVLSRC